MRKMGICEAILTGYSDMAEHREEIFDFTKYPAEPNWGAYNQYMNSAIQCCIRKLAEQERQRITDFIGKGKEEPTMKVFYSGFTGVLTELKERCCGPTIGCFYDMTIYDAEKNVTHSFAGVNLEDVKFLGVAVSFGG